jgi:hypothetical protein
MAGPFTVKLGWRTIMNADTGIMLSIECNLSVSLEELMTEGAVEELRTRAFAELATLLEPLLLKFGTQSQQDSDPQHRGKGVVGTGGITHPTHPDAAIPAGSDIP